MLDLSLFMNTTRQTNVLPRPTSSPKFSLEFIPSSLSPLPWAFIISCLNWYLFLPFLPILYTDTKKIILTCKFDYATSTFKSCQWLSTLCNLKSQVLGMTCKALHDLAPVQSPSPHIFTPPHIYPITLAIPKLLQFC